MAAPAGSNSSRVVMLAISIAAIAGLCFLMKVIFSLPTTTLKDALPDSAGKDTRFSLANGASFPGFGKLQIGDEQIAVERIDPTSGLRPQAGVDLRKCPDTFKILARGANDTKVQSHGAGASVTPVGTLFFPENNATFGEAVDELFYLILWITGIAFIITEGFLLYCVLVFWAKPGKKSLYSHGNHKLELIWTIVPALILVTLAILQSEMWTEMKMRAPGPNDQQAVRVQVIAKQFNWFFRYAGKDGAFGTPDDIAAANMFVPVGQKISIELRSQDTIHSFFLPNFRVKQDAVPGLRVPVWFEALRTGTFQIMCAELCGANHTKMGATLEVLSKEAFDTWIAAESDKWKGENDGVARPEWWGASGDEWWWWDQSPVKIGFQGEGKAN